MSASAEPVGAGVGWVDVTTFELAASAPFFERLFGWEREDVGMADAPGYSLLRSGGEIVAAIDPVPEEKGPPQWTVFVVVPDLEAALAAIEREGGAAKLRCEAILEHGMLGLALDPAGAEFGLWEARASMPARAGALPGRVIGAEVEVPDPAAAARFYGAAFGWRELPGAEPGTALLDAGGLPVAIAAGEAPGWTPWLGVADLGAALARARELGADVIREGGQAALLAGPEDARFGLREFGAGLP